MDNSSSNKEDLYDFESYIDLWKKEQKHHQKYTLKNSIEIEPVGDVDVEIIEKLNKISSSVCSTEDIQNSNVKNDVKHTREYEKTFTIRHSKEKYFKLVGSIGFSIPIPALGIKLNIGAEGGCKWMTSSSDTLKQKTTLEISIVEYDASDFIRIQCIQDIYRKRLRLTQRMRIFGTVQLTKMKKGEEKVKYSANVNDLFSKIEGITFSSSGTEGEFESSSVVSITEDRFRTSTTGNTQEFKAEVIPNQAEQPVTSSSISTSRSDDAAEQPMTRDDAIVAINAIAHQPQLESVELKMNAVSPPTELKEVRRTAPSKRCTGREPVFMEQSENVPTTVAQFDLTPRFDQDVSEDNHFQRDESDEDEYLIKSEEAQDSGEPAASKPTFWRPRTNCIQEKIDIIDAIPDDRLPEEYRRERFHFAVFFDESVKVEVTKYIKLLEDNLKNVKICTTETFMGPYAHRQELALKQAVFKIFYLTENTYDKICNRLTREALYQTLLRSGVLHSVLPVVPDMKVKDIVSQNYSDIASLLSSTSVITECDHFDAIQKYFEDAVEKLIGHEREDREKKKIQKIKIYKNDKKAKEDRDKEIQKLLNNLNLT